MRLLAVAATLVALAVSPAARVGSPAGRPSDWVEVAGAPGGGTLWSGSIPDELAPWDHRASEIYLPPGYDSSRRYPVLYLLHGMRGSPSSFWSGLHLATTLDEFISTGRASPFIVVTPVAGPTVNPDGGEWAGVWEDYVVQDVVPWVDAHLATNPSPQARALEGLCAGGYGAVDIGLRHPRMFDTLGSWEGYFAPVFRDGPFRHASSADLAAHDPTLLVRDDAPELQESGVRFYVSVGGNHADVLRKWSLAFARELGGLGLPHRLWLLPASERGRFWSATVPSALAYAVAGFRDYAPTSSRSPRGTSA